MSSCDPCAPVGVNGAPAGGGAPAAVVTLQAAIDGQGVATTTQAFDTTIGLDGGASWFFTNALGDTLLVVADQQLIGVQLRGRNTTAGDGQDVLIQAGPANVGSGLTGGDTRLVAGAGDGAGAWGMITVESSWATASIISPAALAAGDNDDYAPTGNESANVMRLTPNAAGSNLTGIVRGRSGRRLTVQNIGSANITLVNEDAGSTAANRILTPNANPVIIPPNGSAELWYDTTSARWRSNGQATTPAGSTAVGVLDISTTPLQVQNVVTVTDLVGYNMPANTVAAGSVICVELGGNYTNNSGLSRTPTWQIQLGGTTLWQDDWGGQGASALARAWGWKFQIYVESTTLVHLLSQPLEAPTNTPTVGLGAIDNTVSTAVPGSTAVGGVAVADLATNAAVISINFNHPTNTATQTLNRIGYVVEHKRR